MSRWLNQVNNLLEKLDGTVETTSQNVDLQGAVNNLGSTIAAHARQQQQSYEESDEFRSDDDDYDNEEYFSEEQYSTADDDEEEAELPETNHNEQKESTVLGSNNDLNGTEEPKQNIPETEPVQQSVPSQPISIATENKNKTNPTTVSIPPTPKAEKVAEMASVTTPSIVKPRQAPQIPKVQSPPPPPPPSGNAKLSQQLKRQHAAQLEKLKAEHSAAMTAVQQHNKELQSNLATVQTELQAVNAELQQAAVTVEEERAAAAEERDELLEDQEDALQQLRADHTAAMSALQTQLRDVRSSYDTQLKEARHEHRAEGGTLTAELHDAEARHEETRQRVQELTDAWTASQQDTERLTAQNATLQQRLDAAEETVASAVAANVGAEERLDEAVATHQTQLERSRARQAELEGQVMQLSQSVAAAAASSRAPPAMEPNHHSRRNETDYQQQYELASEELSTVKSELVVTTERCSSLQEELNAMSIERERHASEADQTVQKLESQLQNLQRAYEQKSRKESGTGDNGRMERMQQQLSTYESEVSSLSDQLLRQKRAHETSKSEVLALHGRLQMATKRAETAENIQQQSTTMQSDLEIGRGARRRRVKGGRYGSSVSQRSVRGAMGLSRSMNSTSVQRTVGDTMDAVDNWMLDTGSILRQEPVARLGFALYLTVVHMWCFGLVFFHTIEAEHGDLGALTDHSRVGVLHHQQNQFTPGT